MALGVPCRPILGFRSHQPFCWRCVRVTAFPR